jgi:hypothetical protein
MKASLSLLTVSIWIALYGRARAAYMAARPRLA